MLIIMSLSNAIRTWIIDPTVFNSTRAEYRLNDGVLSSNLKLVDCGVYSTNLVDRDTGAFYPSIIGVAAVIKRISLWTGGTMLDEVQEFASYAAVQHLKVNNQTQEDLARFELLNGISYAIKADDGPADTQQSVGALTVEASHKDYVKKYNEAAGVFKNYHNNQVQISNTDAGGASGMVVLSNYLEFLRSVPVLAGIPDLRLIIEWNTAVGDYYVDADANTAVTPSFAPIRPQLVYEELLGVEMPTGLVKVPYMSMMVERFVVDAAADGVTKSSTFRSGAFRNRFVKDLCFFNKQTATDGWLRAKERSPSVKGEILQLVVNQKKYLADNGISQEAQKLAFFNQTFGGLNIPLVAAMSSSRDRVDGTNRLLDSQTGPISHNFSVTGCLINDVIDRLDIELTRTGSTLETNQTTAYDLLVFGRVNRLLELNNGEVRLSY